MMNVGIIGGLGLDNPKILENANDIEIDMFRLDQHPNYYW